MSRNRVLVGSAAAIVGIGAAAGALAVLLDPARAAVGPLPGAALILPADARFAGGLDMKRFKASRYYAKYGGARGLVPADRVRELEGQIGVDLLRDVDRMVFTGTSAPGAESFVAMAFGRFDATKVGASMEGDKKQRVTWKSVAGRTLYLTTVKPGETNATVVLDERTLIVGSQAAVEAALAAHVEKKLPLRTNAPLMALLQKLPPTATFWMSGDASFLERLPRLAAAPGGGSQFALPGLASLTLAMDFDPSLAVDVVGEAANDAAAKSLADTVRGLLALASMQAQSRPELKDLATAVSVTTDTRFVRVNLRVPYELLDALQRPGPPRPGGEPGK
jgi:hypothetical protein